MDEKPDRLDIGGYLTRVRRIADLNQREAAALVGVGQSTWGRWESGDPSITVRALEGLLRLAALRLAVVDDAGEVVAPFEPDTLRDNAGRRFPAHLDVVAPDQRPANRGLVPRWDRPPPKGWYALRPTRDAAPGHALPPCPPIEGVPTRPGEQPRPTDHPTLAELAERKEHARRAKLERAWATAPPHPVPECNCLDDCFDHPGCLPECPCRCGG